METRDFERLCRCQVLAAISIVATAATVAVAVVSAGNGTTRRKDQLLGEGPVSRSWAGNIIRLLLVHDTFMKHQEGQYVTETGCWR